MPAYVLSLFEDRLAAGEALGPLSLANRMLHVLEDEATAGTTAITCGKTLHVAGEVELRAGPDGACLLRVELGAGGDDGGEVLSAELDLDAERRWILRLDQVDFPLGGIAYEHIHAGPGIRWLVRGQLRVEAGGHETVVRPGEAWFEDGPKPVIARASEAAETGFLRASVLPADYLGRSSLTYVDPADWDKPKLQRYTMHHEVEISLCGERA